MVSWGDIGTEMGTVGLGKKVSISFFVQYDQRRVEQLKYESVSTQNWITKTVLQYRIGNRQTFLIFSTDPDTVPVHIIGDIGYQPTL